MVIVMGTSLVVHPFCDLVEEPKKGVPRILFNMQAIPNYFKTQNDISFIGGCDDSAMELIDDLGLHEEFQKFMDERKKN